MFHLMLLLIPIIALVIIGSMLLFGVVSILAGVLGGASVALLVKDTKGKQLLLIGFGIVLLVGVLCLLPLVGLLVNTSITLFPMLDDILLVFIGVLACWGIKTASTVQNKTAKTILLFIFGAVAVIAVLLIVLFAFLLQM